MIDLSKTTQGKIDQVNADLLDQPVVIKISHLTENIVQKTGLPDTQQPISIHWYGCDGKPFKPCLSMRRVLSDPKLWDKDGSQYKDRYLKLYNDKNVSFGFDKTGGVRISHASHIDKAKTIKIKSARGKKIDYTVEVLSSLDILKCEGEISAKKGMEAFTVWGKSLSAEQKTSLTDYIKELMVIAKNFDAKGN